MNPLQSRPRIRMGFPMMHGGWPVVGHLPALYVDTLALVRRAERELGPMFWLNQGFGHPALYCLDPEAFDIFRNRVTTSEHLRTVAGAFLGESMIVHDGPKHHHMRSAMNAPFTPKGITALEVGPVLAETIQTRIARWPALGEFKLLAQTRELALALIYRMMGIEEGDLTEWREHYEEFMLIALNVPIELPGFPRWRGRRAKAWLDARLLELIRVARGRKDGQGLLWELVHAKDEGGLHLDDQELLDNIRLLLLAGHETTASIMAWMVIAMAEHPEIWEQLGDEAAAHDLPVTPKELKNFPLAEAIFRESLRLHPPVATNGRIVTGELDLMGRRIPEGVMVGLCFTHLGRHPALYKDGDQFMPARWLDRKQPITPIETAQFGGGPHFCLGYHVAWMEGVQFAVALAKTMRPARLRPILSGAPPVMRYLPLAHPDAGTRVRFA
ncbi:MAG: cytochrome P450 [Nannocystis sp.]|nr:cytochrome P450 [Nannocystis sp.]MBA3549411.1 cytochrome P450 [Nannocystis sp.]